MCPPPTQHRGSGFEPQNFGLALGSENGRASEEAGKGFKQLQEEHRQLQEAHSRLKEDAAGLQVRSSYCTDFHVSLLIPPSFPPSLVRMLWCESDYNAEVQCASPQALGCVFQADLESSRLEFEAVQSEAHAPSSYPSPSDHHPLW